MARSRTRWRPVGVLVALLAALPAPAAAQTRAVVAFTELGGVGAVARLLPAAGLLGATQGRYTREQALLDLSAGARTSPSGYPASVRPVPPLVLRGASFAGWPLIRARAAAAAVEIRPGLLAGSVPAGAAFVVPRGPAGAAADAEAVLAADRAGRVARVVRTDDPVAGTLAALRAHRLVVARLGSPAALRALVAAVAGRGVLVLAIEPPPVTDGPHLLAAGAAGLRGGTGLLRSATTRLDGLIIGSDVAPTVLEHLRLPVPAAMQGEPARVVPGSVAALQATADRLRVISGRRVPALLALLGAWALVALVLRDRRALRIGGLAALWLPAVLLATAAAAPASAVVEAIAVAAGCLGAAALTDRLLAWPRAPLVPGAVGIAAYVADLVAGSELVVRSLLGPNPRFGARFYGIGNELEATLAVLALLALGAALGALPRSRRLAAAFALPLAALTLLLAAGRIGADVGAIFTVGGGAAVAAVAALPGGLTLRRALLGGAAVVAGLGVLALIDGLGGGGSHFEDLLGGSWSELEATVRRRLSLAVQTSSAGVAPLLGAASVVAAAVAVARRRKLYGDLPPAWQAALAGCLGAGVVGSVTNDSGTMLLIFCVGLAGFATLYAVAPPQAAGRG